MKFKILRVLILGLSVFLIVVAVASRIHRPDYLNDKGRKKLMVAPMRKEYKDLLFGEEEMLNESPIILVATATGENEYVFHNLKQEVIVGRFIKGKQQVKNGEHIQLVGGGRYEEKSGNKIHVATGFVNYLQKGDQYLIFANKWQSDYRGEQRMLELNSDAITMRCLNLSSDHSYVCQTKSAYTDYENVKDSEFFVSDQDVLEAMLDLKKRLIKKWC